jgi:hypothetical protein
MKEDILSNLDHPAQLKSLYRKDKLSLSGHLTLYIPNLNTAYHTTYTGLEAFKSHLDALE